MPSQSELDCWIDEVSTAFSSLSRPQARVLALYSYGMALLYQRGFDGGQLLSRGTVRDEMGGLTRRGWIMMLVAAIRHEATSFAFWPSYHLPDSQLKNLPLRTPVPSPTRG